MGDDSHYHNRHSIRLKGYDYSRSGGYFVTICTQNRECVFGEIVEGEMRLSPVGQIALKCWLEIPEHFPDVELDVHVVMPNHVHGIVMLNDDISGRGLINQTPTTDDTHTNPTIAGDWNLMKNPNLTLGKIIRHFKARTCKFIHDAGHPEFGWQRNYHDHIIRNNNDLHNIRKYIDENPWKWYYDEKNPQNIKLRYD